MAQPSVTFADLATLLRLISPAAPPSPDLPAAADWAAIEQLSRVWHVAPSLWARLKTVDGIALLPEDLVARLRQGYTDNARRNRLFRAGIVRIATRLNGAGFTPMLLKGAAYLSDPPSGDPATRYMHDLDIMVPGEASEACFHALKSLGFKENPDIYRVGPEHHHWPTLVDPVLGLELELHKRPLLIGGETLAEAYLRDAMAVEENGALYLLPAPHHRITHNVLHAQIIDEGLLYGAFNPRYLLEFAEGCLFYSPEDWHRAAAILAPQRLAFGSWIHMAAVFMAVRPPSPYRTRLVDRLQYARVKLNKGAPMEKQLPGRVAVAIKRFPKRVRRRLKRMLVARKPPLVSK